MKECLEGKWMNFQFTKMVPKVLTSSIDITWELVRNAKYRAPPQTY